MMGDPKKPRRKYDTPAKPWDKKRLGEEKVLKATYGLKNKRELWRAKTILRGKRENARKLLALPLEKRLKRQEDLLSSLHRMGLLSEKASLDDVLSLTIESLLERRLQTIVWRKGLAATPTQARQFVVHGHIAIDSKKVDRPSYRVKNGEEDKISYHKKEMVFEEKKGKTKAEKKKDFEEIAEDLEKPAEKKFAETAPKEEKLELDVEVEEKPVKEEQKKEEVK